MTALQLSLVQVASIWAAMNSFIAAHTAVNGTRDRIVTGRTDEGIPLSPAHRRARHRNGWLPVEPDLALVSPAFAGLRVFRPALADDATVLGPVSCGAATHPLGAFRGFFALGLSERRLVLEALAPAEDESEASR